jgi:ABC-type branched-subunit amino acid transport system permease subunit/ABC-type branched-subunit amino acid transport system ATPase component
MSRFEWAQRPAAKRVTKLTPMVALLVGVLVIASLGDPYYLSIGTQALLYATLALGLNIVVGLGGLLDLGYAGFLAVGSYTYGSLLSNFHLTPIEAIPFVVIAALIAGLVVGVPTLRLRGDYLAIVTLAFGLIAQIVAGNVDWLGGATGLYGLSPFQFGPIDYSTPVGAFVWCFVSMCVVALVFGLFRRSILGVRLLATKGDAKAALASGIPTYRYKLMAYILGAIIAALAGVEYASVLTAISPPDFGVDLSILILVAVIFGGEASIYGVILGGIAVALIPELFRPIPQFRFIALGAILIAVVLVRPRGILPARRTASAPSPYLGKLRAEELLTRREPLPTIEVSSLTVRYGGVTAVDGVSVAFPADHAMIQGILGPNGAGKTTIIDAVTGFTESRFASYRIGEHTLGRVRASRVAALGLRRTFQSSRLFPDLTVFENALIGHPTKRKGGRAGIAATRGQVASAALTMVGLEEEWWGVLASELAYGKRRLAEIARALAGGSALLLIDEPTTGLNDVERHEMADVLRSLRRLNRHVLVIDHDVNFLSEICDQAFALDYGRVIATGDCRTVLAHQQVRESYLGT